MSPNDSDGYDPDPERVMESSERRSREHAEITEDQIGDVGNLLEEQKYPTTSEELALEYEDQMVDMANETESLGSVFDRIVDERFESPAEAREALLNELTGSAGGPDEYNDDRSLSEFDADRNASE